MAGLRICYFGLYDPLFSRNRIYMSGLRANGAEIIECRDTSPGLKKYWELFKRHQEIKNSYDVLVVGYPGHLLVPFARLLTRKPVIADLLGSLTDAEVHSRRPGWLRIFKNALADMFAVWSADAVLLETQAQRAFFERTFGRSRKYHVLYTGVDESVFYCERGPEPGTFLVLFRGRLTPESGILHILSAANLLKANDRIKFRVIGFGLLLPETKEMIERENLTNVELIPELLPEDELRAGMCGSSISLGQFEDNPRLSRTIPHKAFESFAMGIPYLSGDAAAVREVITDGETGFLVPLADPAALAARLAELAQNSALVARVGANGQTAFKNRFSQAALGAELLRIAQAHK